MTLTNFINSLDLCFIQEHWLFYDHLSDVCEISPDFISVGVNCDLLSRGRPYGGCSILYRKSLSSCISPLYSCSDRFCGVRLSDSSGLSYLLVCVYESREGLGPRLYGTVCGLAGIQYLFADSAKTTVSRDAVAPRLSRDDFGF